MKVFVILASMLFLAGCLNIDKGMQIPSGVYVSSEPNGDETVEIRGDKIVFHIKLNGSFWDRQFSDLSVWSDGTIVFPIASTEFDRLHRQCNFTFDGKVIWKEEIKNAKKVSFVRKKT